MSTIKGAIMKLINKIIAFFSSMNISFGTINH